MAEKHFFEQQKHAHDYLIPYFDRHIPGWRLFNILEVGCAEAGFIDVLYRSGIKVTGIELMPDRVLRAKTINSELDVRTGDIAAPNIKHQFSENFDLIVMRDVIEHIPDRDSVFLNITQLLNPGGFLYVTFPPRFSPFGGHHQNGRSFLRRVPYLQLLPAWKIRFLGHVFREHRYITENTILNFRMGLSIRQFEDLFQQNSFLPIVSECFLSRPIYRTRFGWPTIHFPNIPGIRELLVCGFECLLTRSVDKK